MASLPNIEFACRTKFNLFIEKYINRHSEIE